MDMKKFIQDKRQEVLHFLSVGLFVPLDKGIVESLRLGRASVNEEVSKHDVRIYFQGILDFLDWAERVQKDIDAGRLK